MLLIVVSMILQAFNVLLMHKWISVAKWQRQNKQNDQSQSITNEMHRQMDE